ncbi:aldo-keto reductase family 1 member B1-like [Pollicipes pollicipes]|uniref:aldo-keto reductase family 1 member B1-like n=1 Tax=Pollicipes pollicipes TaxID=41117 RepID=UPI001884A387|nr:aldo-keto reductase family 1 member B1-like [Pollicipes pollicipes]
MSIVLKPGLRYLGGSRCWRAWLTLHHKKVHCTPVQLTMTPPPQPAFPSVKLGSGHEMPMFGLGTWKSQPGKVREAVETALTLGYRHIDCAMVYGNEKEIGEAFKNKFEDGTCKREEVFITSKLWNSFHAPELVIPALKRTLADLGLEYLDLYLIHWPMGYKEGDDLFPKDSDGKIIPSDADYVDTWKAMEEGVTTKLVRSLGVSNFNEEQLERVLAVAKVPVCVNQVECHPYLTQKKLMEFCAQKEVVITAYSPLGSPDRPWAKPSDVELMDEPKLKNIADKYKKSVAQVLIRYQLQRGNIVIPKSVTPSRIKENMEILDFELSSADIASIDSFDRCGRFCGLEWLSYHKYHPFPAASK